MPVGDTLKKLLAEKGITPYKVAKDTGLSQQATLNWLNEGREPGADNLSKLCAYFDVPADYLPGLSEQRGRR